AASEWSMSGYHALVCNACNLVELLNTSAYTPERERSMRQPILRPPALQPGDTVGIFAPSAPSHARYPEKYRHGLEAIRRLGYRVKEGRLTATASMEGYRSGPPRERAAELMELILDPEVRAVVATVGGSNSSSLLPYLDF